MASTIVDAIFLTITKVKLMKNHFQFFLSLLFMYMCSTNFSYAQALYKQTCCVWIPSQFDIEIVEREKVLKQAAYVEEIYVPPILEEVEEKVLIVPKRNRWEKVKAARCCFGTDCKLWAIVAVPAEYKIIKRQVLKMPAYTKEVHIPAQYQYRIISRQKKKVYVKNDI